MRLFVASIVCGLSALACAGSRGAGGGAGGVLGAVETSNRAADVGAPSALRILEPATPQVLSAALRAPGARATIVNVWATWCEPCVREFPDIVRAARDAKPRGVRMMFVSADFESERDEAEAFLRAQGVDFTTYVKLGEDQAFIDGLDPSWSGSIPVTMIFDAQANLRFIREGDIDYEALTAAVDAVLD